MIHSKCLFVAILILQPLKNCCPVTDLVCVTFAGNGKERVLSTYAEIQIYEAQLFSLPVSENILIRFSLLVSMDVSCSLLLCFLEGERCK